MSNVLQKDFCEDARGRGTYCEAVSLNNSFVVVLEVVLLCNYFIQVQ
jgi:hypothetical protein